MSEWRECRDFSDEELTVAARRVREALLSAMPVPAECEREFSQEFCRKMQVLIDRDRRQQTRKKMLQKVAAIILCFAVGSAVWLSVDTEARAAVLAWFREVVENKIVYYFFGTESGDLDELPQYVPTWLPDGYSAVDVFQDHDTYSALYQTGDDLLSGLEFAYYTNDLDKSWYIHLQPQSEAYIYENFLVNGLPADLYICTDGSETNNLIWMAADQSVVFELNGFMGKEEMLHIAESVILCDLTN